MPKFEIIEGRPYHCGQIVRRLRAEHRTAMIGVNAHREISDRFATSSFRRAWLIDGDLCALGGVVGGALSSVGYIWLALSQLALAYPVAVVKEARRQLDEIMATRRELATIIVPDDTAALRFAVFLGFHVADQGLGSQAGTRMERTALRRYLEAAEELRIPMENRQVIPMGYHRAEAA
jgi:hypothetical protein